MSDAGRALVIGLVQAVVPVYEPGKGFVFSADGKGNSTPLDARRHINRACELADTEQGVEQGEIASATPIEWRERWLLVVNYPARMSGDAERLRRLMRADMRSLIAALQPPSGWQSALSNLHVGHEPWSVNDITGEGGDVIAYEAVLPIDVEYFATP